MIARYLAGLRVKLPLIRVISPSIFSLSEADRTMAHLPYTAPPGTGSV